MVKRILMRLLPPGALHSLKKWYFPSVLRKVQDADWPYAKIARQLIKPGDTVVDIGANIGYVSSLFSRYVGDRGQVFSFEPIPDTYALLEHGVRRLKLDNVKTFHCALSSSPGTAQMEVPHFEEGGENFYQSHILEGVNRMEQDSRTFEVELKTVDDVLAPELENITFVKIDVEGHELQVLKGGPKLLAQSQPALVIEVAGSPDDAESNAAEIFGFLGALGYQAYIQQGESIVPRTSGVTAVDYFFLLPAHTEKLQIASA